MQRHSIIPPSRPPTTSRRAVFLKAGASSATVAVGNGLTQVIVFTANALVARRLGPQPFGLYAFAVSYAAFFGVFADFGFNSILVRDITSTPRLTGSLLGAAARVKMVLAPAAYLGAIGSAIAAGYSADAVSIVAVTALSIFGLAFGGIGDAGFAARLDMRSPAVLKVSGSLAFAGAIWLASLWQESPRAFAAAWLLVSLLSALSLPLFYRLAVPQLPTHASKDLWRRMLADAWPLGLAGLSIMLYTKLDLLLLTRILGGKETGYYAGAARLNEVAYGIATALMVSIYPVLVRFRDADSFQRLCRLGMRSMAAVAFCLVIVAISSGSAVVTTVYGPLFEPASRVLWILAMGQPLAFCGLLLTAALTTCGQQRIVLESTGAAAACNLILNLFLIPRFGAIGAAWANVCGLAVANAYPLVRPRARWLSGMMFRELAISSGLALVAILLSQFVPAGRASGFGRAMFGAGCFAGLQVFANARHLMTVLRQLRAA